MTKVFIGGSRKLTKLSPAIKSRLDNIITNGFTILIGDGNGADKCIQSYLSDKSYDKVIVFCMEEVCRNNLGNWDVRHITTDIDERNFSYYATKDMAMTKEASHGFMLWDTKSAGTLNNIINLLKENKKILVYLSPDKSFHVVGSFSDLQRLLSSLDKKVLERFDRKLGIAQSLKEEQSALEFA